MSHWFHRNPLKATAPVSFNLCRGGGRAGGGGQASGHAAAIRLCSELRTSRARLLEMFGDADASPDAVKDASDAYFSLLQGFVVAGGSEANDDDNDDDNEMRFVQKFRWTDTLQQGSSSVSSKAGNGGGVTSRRDAVFELASMAFNVALWHAKHAARTAAAAKDDAATQDAEAAAGVHRSLRVAAGIFTHLRDVQAPRLAAPSDGDNKGLSVLRDLEPHVLEAYAAQCRAEAQEVSIVRAVELGHEAALVAGLALHTAELYGRADAALKPGGSGGSSGRTAAADKWRKYLQLKQSFYEAYAHCYHGQTLLAADRCGESIACLRKAQSCYGRAQNLCKEYRQCRGGGDGEPAGASRWPSEQLFFLKLGRLIESALDKSQRENDFIYFHKVPAGEPRLQLRPSHGLAEPVAFDMPAPSELWATPGVYAAFRLGGRTNKSSSDDKSNEEVRPVKEPGPKPQKDTGCVVS